MNTHFYDCEECFRALALILMKNDIFYITQKAFDMYIKMINIVLNEKKINNEIFGELNFNAFTNFTRHIVHFEDEYNLAILNIYKKDDLQKTVFKQELLDIAESPMALSIFGLSDNIAQNIRLYSNKLNHQQFELVKSQLKVFEKLNNPLFFEL